MLQVKKLKLVGYDMLEATGEDIPAATYADEYEKVKQCCKVLLRCLCQ